MHITASYRRKQIFAVVIKLAIVVGAVYFIYNRLAHKNTLDFPSFLKQLQVSNIITFQNGVILLGATFLNWFLEILKWQQLASYVKKINFWESTQQSLGSLTASLFTPNRIGEYGVKVMYFSKHQRKRILGLNFLGNCAQMLATVCFGLIGFSWFVLEFSIELPMYKVARMSALLLLFGCIFLIGSKQKKIRIKGFSFQSLKTFLKKVPISIHSKNITISFIRYAVFAHQFYFLLLIFGIETPYKITMSAIASMYLISSLIPMLFIFDVVVKGSIAVWVFGFLNINELAILSVTTIMWILNFVLPSIIGSYFVMRFDTSFWSEEPQETI